MNGAKATCKANTAVTGAFRTSGDQSTARRETGPTSIYLHYTHMVAFSFASTSHRVQLERAHSAPHKKRYIMRKFMILAV
uniref:Secreted protein n=1 Tax=Ascaris lumbricoides TaxID=6252 RepID=A0A0M3I4R3_ASCLU